MKARNKPIFLIIGLVVLFGVVAYMQKPATSGVEPPPQQEQPTKTSDVSSEVSKQLNTPKIPKKGMMGHQHPGGPGGADGPSLLKPHYAAVKPKPNDSATSTQWYNKESARGSDTSH